MRIYENLTGFLFTNYWATLLALLARFFFSVKSTGCGGSIVDSATDVSIMPPSKVENNASDYKLYLSMALKC